MIYIEIDGVVVGTCVKYNIFRSIHADTRSLAPEGTPEAESQPSPPEHAP